jgi:hypothetical protein
VKKAAKTYEILKMGKCPALDSKIAPLTPSTTKGYEKIIFLMKIH